MRILRLLLATSLFGAATIMVSAKEAGTISTNPSPLLMDKGATINISTSDIGNDVYLFCWISATSSPIDYSIMTWDEALTPKNKMSGKNGEYSMNIANLMEFYGFRETDASKVTRLGFIARSAAEQTEDMLVEVDATSFKRYSGGKGTADNPFILTTTGDLARLTESPVDFSAHFRLDADIDATGISAIGTTVNPFCGTFDGNNHIISNFNFTSTDKEPTGLFKILGGGAKISNLGVTDAEIRGLRATGLLAGAASSGCTIERCYTTGTVISQTYCSGGIVGDNQGATIRNCYSLATVSSEKGSASGGLVGKNRGNVDRCYAAGNVSAFNYAGGLIGANYGDVSASVSLCSHVDGATNSTRYIGSFGGNNNSENHFNDAYAWIGSASNGWGIHAHHATDHSLDLSQKETYQNLNWDFDRIWEWKTDSSGNSFALLRNIAGQKCPAHIEDILTTSLSELNADKTEFSCRIIDGYLYISSVREITSLSILSLDGRKVFDTQSVTEATDCTRLAPGIYIVVATYNNSSVFTAKIIKK